MSWPSEAQLTRALPNIMNIVINPTVDDGSIRAAAILRTQEDLRRALAAGSSHLDDVARQTLVQTSIGVRTLGALVANAVEHDDGGARLASLVAQSRQCGLSTVSEGLLRASTPSHADPHWNAPRPMNATCRVPG